MHLKRLAFLLAVVFASLALTAPAFAQTATEDAYDSVVGAQEFGGGGGSDNAAQAADSSGSLPFTGLELGVIALMGAGLLGTGVAIRRVSRTRPTA